LIHPWGVLPGKNGQGTKSNCGDSARGAKFLAGVRNRWRRGLLLDQHPEELPEIGVIQEPTHHVRRDAPRAVPVKPMLGHELKLSIASAASAHSA
jgi:hypothetical protein